VRFISYLWHSSTTTKNSELANIRDKSLINLVVQIGNEKSGAIIVMDDFNIDHTLVRKLEFSEIE